MEFKKYPSIERKFKSYPSIEKDLPITVYDDWVVTEKIHGANLSFLTDGKTVNVCSRNRVLTEPFYSSDDLLTKYKDKVIELKNSLAYTFSDLESIQIYGEMFGGYYNNASTRKRINKGVQYCPDHNFAMFDVRASFSNGKKDMWLNWGTLKTVSAMYEIMLVPEIYEGTYANCLKIPIKFTTRIPNLLGLPPLENNYAEGVVIKTITGHNIFKRKTDLFKEVSHAKKERPDISPIVAKFLPYINENRLSAVLSKGDVDINIRNFGKINKLFVADVIKDSGLQEEYKQVKKEVNKATTGIIREYFSQI